MVRYWFKMVEVRDLGRGEGEGALLVEAAP
jgi:hypothetical protein